MKALQRPGRAAAVVGAVVAVSATSLIALLGGTAAANEPGKCVENVNVREQPDATSSIVALCEAGRTVQVGATNGDFVQLVDLNGWAAKEFIAIAGAEPGAPRTEAAPAAANGGQPGADSEPSEFGAAPDGETPPDGAAKEEAKPAPGGPLGGLLD
ncbi:MAG: SH3 domain-containing protein [Pseudonocardia sp.]